MALIPLAAMIRKDLQLFFTDRRSVVVSFVVPIAIASFFGSVFSGPALNREPARIDVIVVDEDRSAISKAIVSGAQADRTLAVTVTEVAAAREAVGRGQPPVAVIIPPGFGQAAGAAFVGGGEKPPLQMLHDPSRTMELAVVRGTFTEHVMQAVSREMFRGDARWPGLSLPYIVREEALTARAGAFYNGYAHAFAGMGIQFLLFAMANLGVEMLWERQRGLWKRLRSAPISRVTLLTGKVISGAAVSLMILGVCFAFAMIVFGVRVQGSVAGFAMVTMACALMASTFGVLVAALGNTPATARGVTTLAVLMMVMLGGAWVPTFIFPVWLQRLTVVVPVRWAVDGLDAMTWRGIGIAGAVTPSLVLVAFAALFGTIALLRFRWQES